MSPEPIQRHLWYVRKGGQTNGPFPPGKIAREILLGRLRKKDEVSTDREHWQHPSAVPQLVPEIMKHTDTEQGRQQLTLARLREDERLHERRGPAYAPVASNRRHGDQRTVGSIDTAGRIVNGASFVTGARLTDEEEKDESKLLLPAAVIMVAIFIFTTYILW